MRVFRDERRATPDRSADEAAAAWLERLLAEGEFTSSAETAETADDQPPAASN